MLEYPNLNFGHDEMIDMLRSSVQSFSKKEIAPIAAKIDEKNEFPNHMWKKLGDLGVLGITAPEEYGGANLGYLAHCVAMEEISRGSASIGLSYGAHSNLTVNQI
ncbi:MAG: acyl-CoA dehydrogenase family protein, partial [Sphingomonadales bacterium]